MKQFFLSLVVILALTSCSDDESSTKGNSISQADLIGVWSSEKYFLSFSSDGYYAAYIEDDFIDYGEYSLDTDSVIRINSSYLNTVNTFKILELSKNKIIGNAGYTEIVNLQNRQKYLEMNRTDINPVASNNDMIGHTYMIDDGFDSSIKFLTRDYAIRCAGKSEAQDWPINMFYTYIDGKIYFQSFGKFIGQKIIDGWNDNTETGKVQIWKVSFDAGDGRMLYTDITDIVK